MLKLMKLIFNIDFVILSLTVDLYYHLSSLATTHGEQNGVSVPV